MSSVEEFLDTIGADEEEKEAISPTSLLEELVGSFKLMKEEITFLRQEIDEISSRQYEDGIILRAMCGKKTLKEIKKDHAFMGSQIEERTTYVHVLNYYLSSIIYQLMIANDTINDFGGCNDESFARIQERVKVCNQLRKKFRPMNPPNEMGKALGNVIRINKSALSISGLNGCSNAGLIAFAKLSLFDYTVFLRPMVHMLILMAITGWKGSKFDERTFGYKPIEYDGCYSLVTPRDTKDIFVKSINTLKIRNASTIMKVWRTIIENEGKDVLQIIQNDASMETEKKGIVMFADKASKEQLPATYGKKKPTQSTTERNKQTAEDDDDF